jgi:hypothetical protein
MPEISPSKYMVQAGWDDVPHLDEKTKKELLDSTPPYLREARSEGTPSLGAGAIYPVPLGEITVQPFRIPDYWPRAYGLDVGWNFTAATWTAKDPSDGVLYTYSEYKKGRAEPVIHAEAVKARGIWIPGLIDPASRGRGQAEGRQLYADYQQLGLNITPADNHVDAGTDYLWRLLSTGRLKVFSSLVALQAEYRLYRRDEKGRVVKENDHIMDAWRYNVKTFDSVARVRPVERDFHPERGADRRGGY